VPTIGLLGVLIVAVGALAALGGASDATSIHCERSAPEAAVRCTVSRSFLGAERKRADIDPVLSVHRTYHQRTRGSLVFARTTDGEDVSMDTTSEDAATRLAAFMQDSSRSRFDWKAESWAPLHAVLLALGALLAAIGIVQWLTRRRQARRLEALTSDRQP
jgi:hypothetical protein